MTNEELQAYYNETNNTLTILTALLNCSADQITTQVSYLINDLRIRVRKEAQAQAEAEPAPKSKKK